MKATRNKSSEVRFQLFAKILNLFLMLMALGTTISIKSRTFLRLWLTSLFALQAVISSPLYASISANNTRVGLVGHYIWA